MSAFIYNEYTPNLHISLMKTYFISNRNYGNYNYIGISFIL